MANIYKDGVYYVNGKPLNPPAQKTGINPVTGDFYDTDPAYVQPVGGTPLNNPAYQQPISGTPLNNSAYRQPSGLQPLPGGSASTQQPVGGTPLNTNKMSASVVPNVGSQSLPNYGMADPNARLTPEQEQEIRRTMGLDAYGNLSAYSSGANPNPGNVAPSLAYAQQGQQMTAQTVPAAQPQAPVYTNIPLQGDIPLGQLAQIGQRLPADLTPESPNFLGALTGAVQQVTNPQPVPTGDPATDPNHPANVATEEKRWNYVTGIYEIYTPTGWIPDAAANAAYQEQQRQAAQPPPTPGVQPGSAEETNLAPSYYPPQNQPVPATQPQPTPGTTQAPQVVTPQQNYADMFSLIMNMLNNYSQPAQGSAEPYNPSSSQSEGMQALQDKQMELLNRKYGFTTEEEAAMMQRQVNSYNQYADEDLRRMEGLFEQYGLNSGAGELGGQAGSSLQDYYGKRAQALADLTGQMGEYFAAKRAGDEQAAVQMAGDIQQQIYTQVRGDFQDMLSYLETQETIDNNTFNRAMTLAGFQSEEAQRDFLNQLGISDRASQDYWMGATTAFEQGMDTAQFTAQQNQQQFNNQMTAAGFDAEQAQWLFNNQATIAELASQMTQQEFTNAMTEAGFNAQQAQALFQNQMAVAETGFNQQVQSQDLTDQGLQLMLQMVEQGTVSPEQIFSLVAGLTQQEVGQFTTAMNNDQNQMSALALPLALMMNLLANNANAGTTVNVNNDTGETGGDTPATSTGGASDPGMSEAGDAASRAAQEAIEKKDDPLDVLKKAGLAAAVIYMAYTGYKAIEGLIDETKFKNEVDRKDREREGAKTRTYTSLDAIGQELSGSEWKTAREGIDSLIQNGPTAPKLLKDPLRASYSNMEEAYAARVGYEYLKAAPDLFTGSMTFNDLIALGRSVDGYPYSQKLPF